MNLESSTPIRVMIVDDHLMVRRGLATFLRVFPDLALAGEAEDGEDAIQRCAEIMPDVILMDIVMPKKDGVFAISAIHQKYPQIQILALTSFKEGELVKNALKAGAIGYLLKDVSVDGLAHAIRSAYAGRVTLAPEAAQALVKSVGELSTSAQDLTARELEVLSEMVKGLNNTQIAAKLSVSPSTIKTHVSSILSKFGVASRTQAVTLALRNHIVS